jgi:hypothetical protein
MSLVSVSVSVSVSMCCGFISGVVHERTALKFCRHSQVQQIFLETLATHVPGISQADIFKVKFHL